jgi:hypothetical protein
MQALEGNEQPVGLRRLETDPVVLHLEDHGPVFAVCRRHADARPGAGGGELPGVAHQVVDHHAQQPGIADRVQSGRDVDLHRVLRLLIRQLLHGFERHGAQVHDGPVDGGAADVCQGQ